MLKLKLQDFGHLMRTNSSLEKSLMLGKIEGRRRRGHQMMRQFKCNGHELGQLWEMVRDREAWHAAVCGIAKVGMTGRLNNNSIVSFNAGKSFQLEQWALCR